MSDRKQVIRKYEITQNPCKILLIIILRLWLQTVRETFGPGYIISLPGYSLQMGSLEHSVKSI